MGLGISCIVISIKNNAYIYYVPLLSDDVRCQI